MSEAMSARVRPAHFGVRRAPGDFDFDARVDLLEVEGAGAGGVGIAVAADLLDGAGLFERVAELRGCGPSWRCRRT